jgi:hypothetical protein
MDNEDDDISYSPPLADHQTMIFGDESVDDWESCLFWREACRRNITVRLQVKC